jgi:hypothetical protein
LLAKLFSGADSYCSASQRFPSSKEAFECIVPDM